MPRIAIPILFVLLLLGLLMFFASQAREVPTRVIETDVGQPPSAR